MSGGVPKEPDRIAGGFSRRNLDLEVVKEAYELSEDQIAPPMRNPILFMA